LRAIVKTVISPATVALIGDNYNSLERQLQFPSRVPPPTRRFGGL